MDERPDLLLGIIVTHVAKQQQPVHQPVAGKVASKTWTYSEYQERSSISESPISLHSSMPTMTTASSTVVIHETETIASPASQVNELCFKKIIYQTDDVKQQQQPPFYGRYTGQPALAGTSVKNWGFCWCKVLLPACPC